MTIHVGILDVQKKTREFGLFSDPGIPQTSHHTLLSVKLTIQSRRLVRSESGTSYRWYRHVKVKNSPSSHHTTLDKTDAVNLEALQQVKHIAVYLTPPYTASPFAISDPSVTVQFAVYKPPCAKSSLLYPTLCDEHTNPPRRRGLQICRFRSSDGDHLRKRMYTFWEDLFFPHSFVPRSQEWFRKSLNIHSTLRKLDCNPKS